jgi:hypothetical protein
MHSQSSIEKQLQELELCLLQPGVHRLQYVVDLLAENFVEFGSSGRIFTKEQTIASLETQPVTECTATQFEIQLLAPHLALVTYRAHRHSEPPVDTLRSSIWEQREGRWQILFHQGTLTSAPQ